jgi:hypothetical protein
MEKIISWTDRVRNDEGLHGVKGERSILRTVKKRKANWIGTAGSGTVFYNTLRERSKEECEDEEEEISSNWMSLRKQ